MQRLKNAKKDPDHPKWESIPGPSCCSCCVLLAYNKMFYGGWSMRRWQSGTFLTVVNKKLTL